MNTSRRDFIKFGALAAVFGSANFSTRASSAAQNKLLTDNLNLQEGSKNAPLDITAKDFKQCVGTEFMLLQLKGATSIILVEITETLTLKDAHSGNRSIESTPVTDTAKNFVLSFQLPTGKFSQKTYQLWHPNFGQFDLFLVPGRRIAPFMMYSVINQI